MPKNTACRVDRKCDNTYEIFDIQGRSVTVTVKDHHLLHLARMLGFEPFYENLEDQLELSTESWTGTLLIKEALIPPGLLPSGRDPSGPIIYRCVKKK